MDKKDFVEKMRNHIDLIIAQQEKLTEAENQARFWRTQETEIRNYISNLQKEGKEYVKEIFGE